MEWLPKKRKLNGLHPLRPQAVGFNQIVFQAVLDAHNPKN
jgi:hypothetical protein